jgi:hypothetical protein
MADGYLIQDGTIENSKLANNTLENDKIKARDDFYEGITGNKIANGSITPDHLAFTIGQTTSVEIRQIANVAGLSGIYIFPNGIILNPSTIKDDLTLFLSGIHQTEFNLVVDDTTGNFVGVDFNVPTMPNRIKLSGFWNKNLEG